MFAITACAAAGCAQGEAGATPSVGDPDTVARIDTPSLDWDHIDQMPTPPGIEHVYTPWSSGSQWQYSVDIALDYKRANGWELLYNTFNSTALEGQLYFILYNKYTGVIRTYLYIPLSKSYLPSDNIAHTLWTDGSHAPSSPILNFADQPFVDIGHNSRTASLAEPWKVAPGNWYVFQFELAYDAATSDQRWATYLLHWPVVSHQITQVIIDGTVQGTLNGRITVPGVDLTVSPSVTNTEGQVIIQGDHDAGRLSGLGQAFVTGLQDALQHTVSHAIEGFLSGILGTNSDNGQNNVELALNARISLTGSLQNSTLISSETLAIPGYDQTNTPGFSPAYNEPLGVFYLRHRPTVEETVYITPQTNANGQQIPPRRQYVYDVDPDSVQMDVNPSVLSRASISAVRREVVVYDPNGGYPVGGQRESVAGRIYYTGDIIGTDGTMASIAGVRLSFEVIPHDGSPAATIVKMFIANKTTTEIVTPPGEDQW